MSNPMLSETLGKDLVSGIITRNAIQFPNPLEPTNIPMRLFGYPRRSCNKLGNNTKPVNANVPIMKDIMVPKLKFLSKNIRRLTKGFFEKKQCTKNIQNDNKPMTVRNVMT